MKISDFVNSLKEFFLDFLGYFSPGFLTMLILTIVLNESSKIEVPSIFAKESGPIIFIFISYILGYIIFSISEIFINIFIPICNMLPGSNVQNRTDIENGIKEDSSINLAKDKLKKIWQKEELSEDEIDKYLNDLDGRKLRNLLMSFTPDSDTKIYTFTFRSDLSRHLAFVLFNIGLLGFLISMINLFTSFNFVFKTEWNFVVLYLLMMISSYYLVKGFSRFLSISYRIPFSIFLAKNINS